MLKILNLLMYFVKLYPTEKLLKIIRRSKISKCLAAAYTKSERQSFPHEKTVMLIK